MGEKVHGEVGTAKETLELKEVLGYIQTIIRRFGHVVSSGGRMLQINSKETRSLMK